MCKNSTNKNTLLPGDDFCVIIPTCNNSTTLKGIIGDVLQYTKNLIIVNDGSTDDTLDILSNFQGIDIISYEKNRGKGFALKKGFEFAYNNGYTYAITIDADGQHFADDIPAFLKKIYQQPGAIIVGARNMEQDGIPKKSNFGNRFSNFWFRFETGIKLPDTQSGFRLYPLDPVKAKTWYTNKFEFEIEVLVRLAWSGVKVTNVPVKVYYAPKETRVSHFRPFVDFARISILNTVLVLIAIFYIRPRDITRNAFSKSLKTHFKEQVSNSEYSNLNLSFSVALGIFMGIAPVWGYQMVIAVFFAHILKLNKVITLVSSNISIPPMIPVILFLSVKTGELLLGTHTGILLHSDLTIDFVKSIVTVYIAGSIAFGLFMSVITGIISFMMLSIFRNPVKAPDK